ncbi:MAG TPA: SCO family protein [Sphingobacteriaceae bacterium]|nr:SCO family protein [Sphingobacteriaceae bacterium]
MQRPASIILLLLLALLVLAACGSGAQNDQGQDEAGMNGATAAVRINPPKPAPDFELIDQHGNSFRLSEQQGNAVVLFFGYTTCPDVCPATLGQLRVVKEQLGEAADRTRFVFVSVDPARDTPEALQKMVSRFGDEEFIGLTGDPADLVQVWQDYNVYVEQVPAEGEAGEQGHYWVTHSSYVYLVNPDGVMELLYFHNFDVQGMAEDIKEVLAG